MDPKDKSTDDFLKKEFSRSLERGKGIEFSPSPYLKTRVLARISEKQRAQSGVRLWRMIGLASSVAALAVVSFFVMQNNAPKADFVATIDQVVIVRVAVGDLNTTSVASARIELEDGVNFYSEGMPSIETQRFLKLVWNKDVIGDHLPIVISGKSIGQRKVRLKLYDQAGLQVAEKVVSIKFNKG